MLAVSAPLSIASPEAAHAWFSEVRARLADATIAPYLGPAVSGATAVPASYDELAAFLGKKVALPKRARGNPWAAAQFIESQKHRNTVVKLLAEAFAARVAPSPLQRHLAGLRLPLIVDTWYDDAMRAALADHADFCELQGISRAGIGEARWYRAYGTDGREIPVAQTRSHRTLLYKPHGAVTPAQNFLISDSDYVEVLTEIDIQSPIADVVQERRKDLGFCFLGCRFHDQMLRIYARQIVKRSSGPRFALVDPDHGMTRNEQRLFAELGVRVLVFPWADGFQRLIEG